jgi:Flp pilus assembly protein TadD
LRRASALYQSTGYVDSLRVLAEDPAPDAGACFLSGKNYFMLGDFKKACQFFERALAVSPTSSHYELWLGHAWGRRAETRGRLTAVAGASKARTCFKKAAPLADRKKDCAAAEAHPRRAVESAPSEAGRIVDLAQYVAKRETRRRLHEYLHASLTPDGTPRQEAEKFLRRAGA